ncbi:hypothetical protein BJY52DRAFT_269378 [Lactarius psammicola]|nr:hypothetical protein BJY52DRAFT_903381 [Lactarius psammicola]KAI9460635.1 hypothetical protein BJY52DRAFT_269378 [Lactarius psammicola]
MPSNSEVRVTPYGIPYVVEFANVSIWPRPPIVHADVGYHTLDLLQKPSLSRSNTLPTTSTHKALPSPPLPVRSKSLKLFRSKTSVAHVKPELAVEGPDSIRPVIRRKRSLTADARNSAHRHFKIFNDEFSASEETLVEPEVAGTFPPPVHAVPSEDGLSLRTGGLYIQFPTSSPTNSEDPSGIPSLPTVGSETEGTLQVDFEKATRARLYRLSRAISKAVLAAGMEAPPKPTRKFDAEVSAGANCEDARLVKGSQGLFKGTYGQVRAAFRAAGLVTTPCGEDGVPDATRLGALFIANPDGRGAIVFTKVVMWG